jgi:hypothetical protein
MNLKSRLQKLEKRETSTTPPEPLPQSERRCTIDPGALAAYLVHLSVAGIQPLPVPPEELDEWVRHWLRAYEERLKRGDQT